MFEGDIGALKVKSRSLFDSFPSLSLCFKSLATDIDLNDVDFGSKWCYELNNVNYYSEIFIHVTSPVLNLVSWLQATEYGILD